MSSSLTRLNLIGKTLDVVLWVQARKTPFSRKEMAAELEIGPSCAHRYLRCLEARDIVRSDRPRNPNVPWVWMATPIAEAQ